MLKLISLSLEIENTILIFPFLTLQRLNETPFIFFRSILESSFRNILLNALINKFSISSSEITLLFPFKIFQIFSNKKSLHSYFN